MPRVPQHDPQGVQGLPPGDQPQDDGEEEGAQRHGRKVAAPVADAAAEDARQSGEPVSPAGSAFLIASLSCQLKSQ